MQKCYILIDILQDTTWTFVNTHVCRNHNWSLVSLHSELEQDFVGYLLISRLNKENYQNVHIGKKCLKRFTYLRLVNSSTAILLSLLNKG